MEQGIYRNVKIREGVSIRYLKHKEIDKKKWDACIASSISPKVYALSWYLDIFSPNWEALVWDDYEAVFPVPWKMKWNMHYIATPLLCQQLGVYSKQEDIAAHVTVSLKRLSSVYKFIDLQLNETNLVQKGLENTTYIKRSNYILPLHKPYQELYQNFSTNCKRNIAKAQKKKLHISEKDHPEDLIHLFKKHKAQYIKGLTGTDYRKIQKLMKKSLKEETGKLWTIRNTKDEMLAGAYWIFFKDRWTFLFSATSEEGKKKGATFLLMDHFISQHGNSGYVLDFEGSDIPGLIRFYEGFGGQRTTYLKVVINKLPCWMRWVKKG